MADRTIEYKVIIDTSTGKSSITDLNGNLVEAETLTKKLGETTQQATEGRLAGIRDLSVAYQGVKSVISDVVNTVSVFIEAANKNNLALKGLAESARVFGQDQQKANEYAKQLASDGLMTLSSSAGTLKMLMASGFNITEAMQLSKSLKDIGSFNNVVGDLNAAMYDVARGIKTGSVELIENIGFTQRLSSVMKQANVDISAGIDITNNLTQRRALYNAIMSEGQKFEGNAARLAEESAAAYTQLGKSWEKLKAAIGDVLNEVFVPLAKILNQLAMGAMKDLPILLGLASGAAVALIAPVVSLTGSVAALGAAVTAATGGLNLLIAAGAALTVGGIAYVATMDDKIKATQELTESTKTLSETELNAAMDKAAAVDFAMMRTIDYMKLKDKELEQASIAAGLAGFSNKEAAERYSIHHQALLQAEETLKKNTAAWNAFYDQRKILADVKIAEMTEDEKAAAAKKLEEQKKLDDELFQERMAAENAETERQKAEQEKRIANNLAYLTKKQADEDAANDAKAAAEIENEYSISQQLQELRESSRQSQSDGLQLQLMQVDDATAKTIAKWQEMRDKNIASEAEYAQAIVLINQTAENQKHKIREDSYKQAGMSALKNLQSLKALGSDGAKIAKAAAISETTINTYAGATAAYKSLATIPIIGPGLGIAAAAAAIAAGMANIAAITATSTGYQSGGYTGDLPENQAAGTVHGREFVMNAETTRRVGVQTLSAIQAGVPVTTLPSAQFAGNATTSGLNSVSGSVQAMNMNMVNGTMPAPVIEINANTDLVNFEIKRREVSNEVDKTGRSFDNVS